ncbi:MAG: response regulator transcription factor [Polyangia bacterium]
MSRARVLLADDHALFLDGLRKVLEPALELVGAAQDGRELVEAAARLDPDVVLLDISMPVLGGLDAARQLRQAGCRAQIVFVTMHREPSYVKEAFRAGAAGYVLKHAVTSELMTAVSEVLRGNFYLSPLVTKALLGELLSGAGESGTSRGELTARQREVLRLVAEGNSAKAVAARLGISQKTVEFHKSSIMRQLGLRSTAELTRYAVSRGLLDEEPS